MKTQLRGKTGCEKENKLEQEKRKESKSENNEPDLKKRGQEKTARKMKMLQ